MATLTDSLAHVRARIARAGGDPGRITIVAVAKRFDAAAVRRAIDAGLSDIGENTAGELVEKATALGGLPVVWHFVGSIQRNKIARIAPHVGLWHSVDRMEEADAIARHQPGAAVLVQVNLTDESTKGGCRPEAAKGLVDRAVMGGLHVRGLMTIGKWGDPAATRRAFRDLATLRTSLGLEELSMGMSDDFEIAVAEGASILRLGTALFGPRPEASGLRN